MSKKFISVFAAITMLSAAAAPLSYASVSEDTDVYNYDYSNYTSGADAKTGANVTTTSYSWGTPSTAYPVLEKGAYWICSAKGSNDTDRTQNNTLATVNFSGDNTTLENCSDGVVLVDLDYGAFLNGYSTGTTENMYLKFMGVDSDGNEVSLATCVLSSVATANTSSADGDMYFEGAEGTTASFIAKAKQNTIGEERDLKIYFDMKNQTYTAYTTQLATSDSSDAGSETLLADNLPFLCKSCAVYPKSMVISAQNYGSGDAFVPVTMKLTALSDATVAKTAAASLSIAGTATENITLPDYLLGASITWSSSNTGVIANDGTVNRPNEDTDVTLTATVTKGESTQTKAFTVAVTGTADEVTMPSDGVWVNDDMDYSSVDSMPGEDDQYGFVLETTENGTYSVGDSKLTLSVPAADDAAGFKKYVAPSSKQTFTGNQVFEMGFTTSGTPKIYMCLQSYSSWKGILTLQLNANQNFSPYNGSSVKLTEGTHKLTIVNNVASAETVDIYLDDVLQWNDSGYRDSEGWSDYYDFGKFYMSLQTGSGAGSSVSVDYIRLIEDPIYYADFCLDNEKTPDIATEASDGDTIDLPTKGEYNNTISWASSDESVIGTDGTVSAKLEDTVVTLTPTYSNNVAAKTKTGEGIDVTVKARAAKQVVSDTALDAINPTDLDTDIQAAVGFAADFDYSNAVGIGFRLDYTGKDSWDVPITVPDTITANTIKAGIIISYDSSDEFVLDNLTVKSYTME